MVQQLEGGTLVRTFVYNAANRLVRVEDGSGQTIAAYAYDPFGRRLWKEVNGIRTYFFYADEGLIAEYDGLGNELRSYGYKPDSTWTTDPLWLKESGAYYWYQNDHLGTPQKIVDSSGTVVWSAQYAAFGEATVSVETVTNNLRFPGQYLDTETELYYNFQRYYSPNIGRYVSADPIGFDGGDMNWYGYALNSPIRYTDVMGLQNNSGQGSLWCCPDNTKGQTGCCGPDVTFQLNNTIQDIRRTFDDEWDRRQRETSCNAVFDYLELLGLDQYEGNVAFAWDIYELFEHGGKGIPLSHPKMWPESNVKPGAGGSDCTRTVTYQGKCYPAGGLNYVMFGIISERCQAFSSSPYFYDFQHDNNAFPDEGVNPLKPISIFRAWKAVSRRRNPFTKDFKERYAPAISAILAGYHHEGIWPLESWDGIEPDCPQCAIEPSNQLEKDLYRSLRWNWQPYHVTK